MSCFLVGSGIDLISLVFCLDTGKGELAMKISTFVTAVKGIFGSCDRPSRRNKSRAPQVAEVLENRALLAATLFGGYEFEGVGYTPLPSDVDVRGLDVFGNTVIVFGGNESGHGRALEIEAIDGLFSDTTSSKTILSPYEHETGNSSYASVGAVIPVENPAEGQDRFRYLIEGAEGEDADKFRVFSYQDDQLTLTRSDIDGPIRLIGVTELGEIVLDTGATTLFKDGTTRTLEGFVSSSAAVSSEGTTLGGFTASESFELTAQLWNSQGEFIPTYFNSTEFTIDDIIRLDESEQGLIGVAFVTNDEGVQGEILFSGTPSSDGYMITPISSLFDHFTIQATEAIGESYYFVTDLPNVPNDGMIRVADPSATLPDFPEALMVSDYIPNLEGVLDVVVRHATFDESSSVLYVQGTCIKEGGVSENWIISISVTAEQATLEKPTGDFQNLPTQVRQSKVVNWAPVERALGYNVLTTGLNGTFLLSEGVETSQISMVLGLAGEYEISVQAFGENGILSEWSDTTTFTVSERGPLISFKDTEGTSSTITWTAVEGANSYEVWVTSSARRMRVVSEIVSSTELRVELPAGRYWVWVKPLGTAVSQPWSPPATITLETAPVAVTVTSTVENQNVISWTGDPELLYDVWVAGPSSNRALLRKSVTGTSLVVSELPLGEYRAWVRGIDPQSTEERVIPTTRWSTPTTFGVPIVEVRSNKIISWTSYVDTNQYEVWVYDENNQRVDIGDNLIVGTEVDLSSHLGNGNYRFWVRAISADGLFQGLWSRKQLLEFNN